MDASESTRDSTSDARWMSFAEIGENRRISKASAVKLVRRHGWRRQRDNQGQVRALVPQTWLQDPPEREGDSPRDNTSDSTPDNRLVADAVAALRDAVVTLKERAERAESLTDAEHARADRAEVRAAAAEARADSERKQTEAVEADRDMAIATANRLTVEIAAMRRSDALRRAAGLRERLTKAWRGE